jgi:hypothetical protein
MKKPGKVKKMLIAGAQFLAFNLNYLSYMIAPKLVHRTIGYL